jgi:thymidylate kinase
MIEEKQRRRFSERTIESYIRAAKGNKDRFVSIPATTGFCWATAGKPAAIRT